MSTRNLIIFFLILATVIIGGYFYFNFSTKKTTNVPLDQIDNVSKTSDDKKDIALFSIIASNLEVPWALVFLPDRSILFTERPGRVRLIDNKNNLDTKPIAIINDVLAQGEGGLLGITIHPDFLTNHFVYLYYTYANDNGATLNRVVRFKFENNSLSDKAIIVDKIPGNVFHNGGRIKFGPDKFLYITTGDSQKPSLAQNINSLAGKILRVTGDGKPAPDNPFGNEVYSYGHRNPQGITWDKNNWLWETEHGPNTLDEINVINKGINYGWSKITGNQTGKDMETPILNSRSDTWAPSGAAFLNSSIFFAGLRGQALYEYDIETKKLTSHFKKELGRIREVVVGPDNFLYITTSNKDGRGNPFSDDDKIIRINPKKL